ncbi:MAG: hypothetical protein ACYDAE_26385 [Steroidobacteraceae bacterium]
MSPALRKIALTVHVLCSVGWVGSVAGFLALAIAGISSGNAPSARGVYLAMDLITWYVIVPLAFASLVTGIVSSLGTPWGLFRHYWVLIKLIVTVFSTIVLLIHTRPIEILASAAPSGSLDTALRGPKEMMITASAVAVVALVVLTALSVYKPKGVVGYRA